MQSQREAVFILALQGCTTELVPPEARGWDFVPVSLTGHRLSQEWKAGPPKQGGSHLAKGNSQENWERHQEYF